MAAKPPPHADRPDLALLRVRLDARTSIGPGKADILEGIAKTGSIAAAGRRMKMSYKRAWSLVEALNAAFAEPLVTSSRGGEKGGGAALTSTGESVLAHYRSLETAAEAAIAPDLEALRALMHPGERGRIDGFDDDARYGRKKITMASESGLGYVMFNRTYRRMR